MRALWCCQLVGIVALCGASRVSAQTGPAIHGFNGTLATEGTIRSEYKAAHKIIVETADGVDHVYDAAKDLVVHGGTNALSDLKPGSTVVVHYTADKTGETVHEVDKVGAEGLRTAEGIVTRIDRKKKEITIRYDNGKTEQLILTDRAAVDAGQGVANAPEGATRVVVYYSDEAGRKVAHYFKPKS